MGFLLQADGRWNRRGEYGCLYTALTERGARAEYAKVLRHLGIDARDDAPRDLVSVRVRVVDVLDLTDDDTLRRLGVTPDQLTADTSESLELCRSLADAARAQRHSAVLTPSAALAGERNLDVYFDLRADAVRLDVGAVRLALNW